MRVVLDTNVLVSALITKRKPAKLVHNLLGKRIELVISKPILSEFIDVIARPKFRQYADERTVEDFLKLPYPRKKAPEFIRGDELRLRNSFNRLLGLSGA